MWAVETVDGSFSNGYGVVALDSSGNPHVAYTDRETVKYASKVGSYWNIETVDSGLDISLGYTQLGISFALNSHNKPYIMYQTTGLNYIDNKTGLGYSTIDIKLATEKNSRWIIENVSLPPPIRDLGNMVLDSSGQPHFICIQNHYVSAKNQTIVNSILYVSWNDSAWITQPVVRGSLQMGFLALDLNDNPHFTYTIDEQQMYASWTGTYWGTQTAELSGYLAIDSSGNPHISYFVHPPPEVNMRIAYVKYATANETNQTFTPLPTQATTPQPSSYPLSVFLMVAAILVTVGALSLYLYKKRAGD